MTKNEALTLALEALRDIIEGSRLDAAGNRNDDGLIDHDGVHNFKLRISAAHTAIEAVKEALAQPEQKQTGIREIRVTETVKQEQEPVAWMCAPFGDTEYEFSAHQECENCVPCYTTPPKRPWVGLMVAEMEELTLIAGRMGYTRMLQLAEAKLKEKNT